MPKSYKSALDGARYVEFGSEGHECLFAVWHGGHTVNIYAEIGDGLNPVTSLSVGDFSEDPEKVTLAEAKEGIDDYWNGLPDHRNV